MFRKIFKNFAPQIPEKISEPQNQPLKIMKTNMYKPIQLQNTTTLIVKNSINRSPLRLAFLLIPLALGCFALSPAARAVLPAPDGGYPGENTAEGDVALFSLDTSQGFDNTAIGFAALYNNTTGSGNTATGFNALFSLTTASDNTATGDGTLFSNTTGSDNTATGRAALFYNTTGSENTANGFDALVSNTIGNFNAAIGSQALLLNTTGSANTATGDSALHNNTTGGSNIALGFQAGQNLTTGNFNIDIGNVGVAGESKRIRIGTAGAQTKTFIAGISGATVASGVGVIVGSNGQLGTVVSSERFKEAIKPMDKASEAILALKPVTFRYKQELDPEGISQFGLVAEDVEKVNPALVARDDQGKVYTVRYEAVNAMLLNEFLKEHRKVQEQGATIAQLKSAAAKQEATAALQQQEIKALTASLKEQASQIQKVSAQLEVSKPAPQMVLNNQ